MTKEKESAPHLVGQFEQWKLARSANGSGWFDAVRESAISRFAEIGIPTPKMEDYRFTNLAPLARGSFQHIAIAGDNKNKLDPDPYLYGDSTAVEIVVRNGCLESVSAAGDLPEGVVVVPLSEALHSYRELVEPHLAQYAPIESEGLAALNTAFLEEGLFVHVPRNVILQKPVHILYLTDPGDRETVSYPRNLWILEEGADLTILESYAGDREATYWTNTLTEIVLGENAALRHYKLQLESEKAYHIGRLHAKQERASRLSTYSISFGSRIARNDVNLALEGEGIHSIMDGLYLGDNDQLIDHHTFVDHVSPNCESRENYKGILSGKSKGVFNGKILVRRDAQKTDAVQTNRNLLLSDHATINTKPQLEIYADDVKCTHGATIGQLDRESLFYLQARGIDKDTARSILINAFAGEIVERLEFEPMRSRVESLLYDRLPGGSALKEWR